MMESSLLHWKKLSKASPTKESMLRLTATSRGTSLEISAAAAQEARAPDESEGWARAGLASRDVGGGELLGMGDLQAPRSGGEPVLVILAAGATHFPLIFY